MMCNNLAPQSCSTAAPPIFSPPFYVFTVIDKAPAGCTIMLCRCSQQERVIAVGVWSSPRRFGSSGQSCQKLPEDPPGYTRVLLPCSKNLCLSFHFACDANTQHAHWCSYTLASGMPFCQSINNCTRPTCWLPDGDSRVPGTCQRHTCPQDPAAL